MIQYKQQNYIIIIIGISIIINFLVTLSFAYFIYKWKFEIICDCNYSREIIKIDDNTQILKTEKPYNNLTLFDNNFHENKLKIYPRNTWLAVKPNNDIIKMHLPIGKVIIAHTATENCMNKNICSKKIHSMQNYHMNERKFSDISYNFLIGDDGGIYEGRGWDNQPACAIKHNTETICISLIGNFMNMTPTLEQLNSTKILLEEGIKLRKLTDNYKLYGHRQLIPTLSPGDFLYEEIKNWSHFSDN